MVINRVILVVTDGLNKELYVGVHLFAKEVIRLVRKSGFLFTALSLNVLCHCSKLMPRKTFLFLRSSFLSSPISLVSSAGKSSTNRVQRDRPQPFRVKKTYPILSLYKNGAFRGVKWERRYFIIRFLNKRTFSFLSYWKSNKNEGC